MLQVQKRAQIRAGIGEVALVLEQNLVLPYDHVPRARAGLAISKPGCIETTGVCPVDGMGDKSIVLRGANGSIDPLPRKWPRQRPNLKVYWRLSQGQRHSEECGVYSSREHFILGVNEGCRLAYPAWAPVQVPGRCQCRGPSAVPGTFRTEMLRKGRDRAGRESVSALILKHPVHRALSFWTVRVRTIVASGKGTQSLGYVT